MIFRTDSLVGLEDCDKIRKVLNKIFLSDFVFSADSNVLIWSDEQ